LGRQSQKITLTQKEQIMRTSIKSVSGFIARSSLVLVLLVTGWLLQTPAVQAAGPTCIVGASGATYTTIQAAVNDSGCATINVAAGTYNENVVIRRGVTINGSTTGTTIVDGNNAASVFNIHIPNTAVNLNNLIIQHGAGTDPGFGTRWGGGILLYQANLTINNSTIRENQAYTGGGVAMLTQTAELRINHSSIHHNQAVDRGSAVYVVSDTWISNSTISQNQGLPGSTFESYDSLIILNSTISDNGTSGNKSAVFQTIGTLTLVNSILANPAYNVDCSGSTLANSHHNLLGATTSSCGITNGTNGNLVSQAPKLGSLQDNSGATATIELLAGSPAIDGGDDTVCAAAPSNNLDQRGVARPQGAHCDIGAYEATATVPPVVTVSFTPNGQNGWFVTNPAVGSVTAQGLTSITNLRCNNARVDNLMGIGTANASATVSVNAEGSLTIVTCTATDSAGQSGAADGSPNRADIWLDSLAPDTTITAQPASDSAGFRFTGSDTASGVASYQCQLDGGSFAPCTSPTLYNGLSAGSHTFQVRAIDQAGNVDATPANYTWTVSVPLAAPVANDDSYTTDEDAPLTLVAPGVLSNDTDADSPALTALLVSGPTNGVVTLNTDGSFVYTPKANFNGSDSFTYAANDGLNNSNVATVSLTVNAVNDAPVAQNDSYTVTQETPLIISAPGLLRNDSDVEGNALTVSLVSNPANGSVTLNANGGFSYLPNNGFVGTDSFTYQTSDGQSNSNAATVQMTVNPGTGSQPPFGITYSASVDLIGAPCSVMSNVLEDNSLIRLFPERLRYALPSAVTVTAPNGGTQVIPAGTLVDSYYLHADWVNQGQNTAKVFDGNVTFAQPILGILKSGGALLSTNAMLGNPGTTYATGTDQGIEDYDDSVSFSNAGKTLTLHLTVWNTSDALRVITPAGQGITLGGAVEGIGSPCSVVEGKLESDSAIRFFPERLNYVLPTPLTVDGYGADGVGARGMVLPQGARVNVYYVHADLVGDGQGKQLRGTVTFDAPILAVLVDGAPLNNTHNTLGATWHPIVKTAYSARGDQGLEAGDQISVQQNRVDFAFSGNADVDQIRIITAAGGSATVSAATDSAVDDSLALPADAVKAFPVASDTNDAVTPSDNNGVVTTDQLTNQLYLPLVSR